MSKVVTLLLGMKSTIGYNMRIRLVSPIRNRSHLLANLVTSESTFDVTLANIGK